MGSMDRYDNLRKLGAGSFGEVFLVRERDDRQANWVVKKISLPKRSQDRHRCMREVKIMDGLHHPTVVGYKESFMDKGNGRSSEPRLCIVLQYCNCGSLEDVIKRHRDAKTRVHEVTCLDWFAQLVLGLEYLHHHKVLHRDLKPENVFLKNDDELNSSNPISALLGDFGLSRALEHTDAMAQTVCGTPYSMSPELFRNKPYNHKSDIWALGCVIYEMLELHPPFRAQNIQELAHRVKHSSTPVISNNYSPALRELLKVMLHKDVKDRPSALKIIAHPLLTSRCQFLLKQYYQQAGSMGTNFNAVQLLDSVRKQADRTRLDLSSDGFPEFSGQPDDPSMAPQREIVTAPSTVPTTSEAPTAATAAANGPISVRPPPGNLPNIYGMPAAGLQRVPSNNQQRGLAPKGPLVPSTHGGFQRVPSNKGYPNAAADGPYMRARGPPGASRDPNLFSLEALKTSAEARAAQAEAAAGKVAPAARCQDNWAARYQQHQHGGLPVGRQRFLR